MEEEINCFYCQKMISIKAKKCPYCQEWVPARILKEIAKKNKPVKTSGNVTKIVNGFFIGLLICLTWVLSIPLFVYFYYRKYRFDKNILKQNLEKYKIETITIIATMFCVFGSWIFGSTETNYSPSSPTSFSDTPQASIKPVENVFNSPWDGSVYQVQDYLKKVLKDPDSYQGIEWSNVIKGKNGFTVRHKFRSKNSFGGYEIEQYLFSLDKEGNVTGAVRF